jgi:hypothetical protein
MTEDKKKDQAAPLVPRAEPNIDSSPFALALEPSGPGELFKLATLVSDSGMYGMSSPAQAVMSIMTGRELGLPAMTSLRAIHCIPTKSGSLLPCLSAELKESLCRNHPNVEFVRMRESTDKLCAYVGKRRDDETVFTAEWTIERAEQAGLLNRGADEKARSMNNWNRFPRQMLRARARAEIASIVSPEATLGIPTREEVEDERAMTIDARTGEILDGLPKQKPSQRDYRRETDEVKLEISAAHDTDDGREAIIRKVEALKLPEPFRTEVRDAYAAKFPKRQPAQRGGAAKKEQGPLPSQPPTQAPPPASGMREPGED